MRRLELTTQLTHECLANASYSCALDEACTMKSYGVASGILLNTSYSCNQWRAYVLVYWNHSTGHRPYCKRAQLWQALTGVFMQNVYHTRDLYLFQWHALDKIRWLFSKSTFNVSCWFNKSREIDIQLYWCIYSTKRHSQDVLHAGS